MTVRVAGVDARGIIEIKVLKMTVSQLLRKFQIRGSIEQATKSGLDGRSRQFTLPVLRNMIQERFTDTVLFPEVVDELKTMWRNGRVLFTKPDHYREHATGFVGCEPDEWFYGAKFNVVLR
jgi:hypothetical protein